MQGRRFGVAPLQPYRRSVERERAIGRRWSGRGGGSPQASGSSHQISELIGRQIVDEVGKRGVPRGSGRIGRHAVDGAREEVGLAEAPAADDRVAFAYA